MEEQLFHKSASVGCLASLHSDNPTKSISTRIISKPQTNIQNRNNYANNHHIMSWRDAAFYVIEILVILVALLSRGGVQTSNVQIMPDSGHHGACLDLKEMPNFNFDRFVGSWFLAAQLQVTSSSDSEPFCLKADFTTVSKDVHNVQFTFTTLDCNNTEKLSGKPRSFDECILWDIQQSSDIYNNQGDSNKWKVLQTDYKNIAVVHSCQNLIAGRVSEYVFILGRSVYVDPMDMGEIMHLLASWGLPYRQVQFTPHSVCSRVF